MRVPMIGGIALVAAVRPAPAAACDAATLQHSVQRARDAFAALDTEAFREATASVAGVVDCARQPLTPVDIAGYYRVRALSAFFDKDTDDAILFFAAVRATVPDAGLSATLAPVGHPLHDAFLMAQAIGDPAPVFLDPPDTGWLLVDGYRTRKAPTVRPYLFQHVLDDGTLAVSQVVEVGGLPAYPRSTPRRWSPGKTRATVGVSLLGVGLGLYGGAFVARGAYDDARIAGNADGARRAVVQTNGLTGAGIGLMGVGGVLSFVAVRDLL